MTMLKFTTLGGLEPSVPARALPDNGAQVALNINPGSPTFRSLLGDEVVGTCDYTNPASVYRFDRNPDGSLNTDEATGWKSSPILLHMARQQIDDDVSGKIYYVPADGSVPMRWMNAAGTKRQAGVPAPTAAPVLVSITDGYVFTREQRDQEMSAVLDEAERIFMGFVIPSWAGPDVPLPTGWVRTSDFLDSSDPRYPDSLRDVLRVFAVEPASSRVLNTFSDIPADEASWVFDPTLGGSYSDMAPGTPLPGWAAGYTAFWCIPMRAFAEVFDLNTVNIKAALLALKMPGTQGADPLLTGAQADELIARMVEHGDRDGARVAAKINALRAKIFDVAQRFTAGGRVSLDAETAAFYQKPAIQATLDAALDVFAKSIWEVVRVIGSATATPYYTDNSGGA